ncbi:MAG: type II secretion system protein [Lachnospiraceae bacterium]|nr:type II secretion system protein [Lachnospiraceae bacterium]
MKNNKGFSLVELIIVIAIMAILIGIMAPQLIKYLEKSKVSSDLQCLDAIYQALIYAANDPEVVQDAASQVEINNMIAAVKLEDLLGNSNSLFANEFRNSLDWGNSFTRSTYEKLFKSAHDPSNMEIYIQYKGGFMNPIAMWATYTDRTGSKQFNDADSRGVTWTDIGDCICIQ